MEEVSIIQAFSYDGNDFAIGERYRILEWNAENDRPRVYINDDKSILLQRDKRATYSRALYEPKCQQR